MNKILTIIVPTYNMEKYLDKCLTSLILNPSNGEDWETLMQQLEVLVIIDGATDRSSEIAHSYEARYPQTFRVIDKENGNYGSCINRGLKEATGKYIKVLDADDWFDTDVFAVYLRKLQKTEADLVLNDKTEVYQRSSINNIQEYDLPDDFLYTLSDNIGDVKPYGWLIHNIAVMKDLLLRINYQQTEGLSYTDNEFTTYPIYDCKTIKYYKLNLYYYLLEREGQTVDNTIKAKSIKHYLIVLQNITKYYSDYDKTKLVKGQIDYIESFIISLYTYIMPAIFSLTDNISDYIEDIDIIDRNILPFKNIYQKTNNISVDWGKKIYFVDYMRKYHKDIRKSFKWKLYSVTKRICRTDK